MPKYTVFKTVNGSFVRLDLIKQWEVNYSKDGATIIGDGIWIHIVGTPKDKLLEKYTDKDFLAQQHIFSQREIQKCVDDEIKSFKDEAEKWIRFHIS